MKHVDFLEIVEQVFPLIRPQYAQRKADERPHVHHAVVSAVVFAQFMDLSVAVVASGDAVSGPRGLDLLVFQPAVFQALIFVTGLEEAAAPAATEVVGTVGRHVDEIFFADHGPDDIAEIFGNGVAVAFADDLAGILDSELDFKVLVPVRIDLEPSLPDPFGVVFVNVFDFKVVFDVEFLQSGPD